jgi:hypothetical protein
MEVTSPSCLLRQLSEIRFVSLVQQVLAAEERSALEIGLLYVEWKGTESGYNVVVVQHAKGIRRLPCLLIFRKCMTLTLWICDLAR